MEILGPQWESLQSLRTKGRREELRVPHLQSVPSPEGVTVNIVSKDKHNNKPSGFRCKLNNHKNKL